ncbi:MAG: ComF family protein [Saprospiraceae bacterium]
MFLPFSLPCLPEIARGFLHLAYPQLCVACGADAPTGAACFCLRCRAKLLPTDMHLLRENEFTERFWGRLWLESGAAMYYFQRKSPIQRALHHLKYQNQPQVGVQIGREFGRKLLQSPVFQTLEGVVPVPLHVRKERTRGYNQSAMLARGIGEVMGLPVLTGALVRPLFTASQTRKKRMERFENVGDVFAIQHPERLRGKHLLLVDDVLTTGATLETCGQLLLALPDTRLSMATIAIAMH